MLLDRGPLAGDVEAELKPARPRGLREPFDALIQRDRGGEILPRFGIDRLVAKGTRQLDRRVFIDPRLRGGLWLRLLLLLRTGLESFIAI